MTDDIAVTHMGDYMMESGVNPIAIIMVLNQVGQRGVREYAKGKLSMMVHRRPDVFIIAFYKVKRGKMNYHEPVMYSTVVALDGSTNLPEPPLG